ncbi:hypothetical protein HYW83_00460 [Candidatus Peregrinibacteria bacterium]|nr:hypothetical protein [Candidatus Peregrinibacteria bacterium]
MLCSKCGDTDHEATNCPNSMGPATGSGGAPSDEDLPSITGGSGRSAKRTMLLIAAALAVTGLVAGGLKLVGGKSAKTPAVATATAPAEVVLDCTYAANAAVTCTGVLPEPLNEVVEWLPGDKQPALPAPARANLSIRTSDGKTYKSAGIVAIAEGTEGTLGKVKFALAAR